MPTDREKEFKSGLDAQGPLATWQAHTVQRRETVERIAAAYGMTAAALREVNGLGPRAQVRPGQALLVQKRGEGDVQLRFASFSPPSDAGLFITSPSPSSYQVRRGDTLGSIARQFRMSPAELRSLNRLKSQQVAVGQQLQVHTSAPQMVKVKAAGTSATTGRAGRPAPVRSTSARPVVKARTKR